MSPAGLVYPQKLIDIVSPSPLCIQSYRMWHWTKDESTKGIWSGIDLDHTRTLSNGRAGAGEPFATIRALPFAL